MISTTNLRLTSLYMYLNLTHRDVKSTCISNEIINNLIEKCNIPQCTFDISVTREYRGSKDLLKLLDRLDIRDLGGIDRYYEVHLILEGPLLKKFLLISLSGICLKEAPLVAVIGLVHMI